MLPLFAPQARPFRALGWMSPFAFGLLIANRSKPYYAAPALPLMMAAGSAAIAGPTDQFRLVWLTPVVLAVVALRQAILVLLFVPVLPVEAHIRHAANCAPPGSPSSSRRQRAERRGAVSLGVQTKGEGVLAGAQEAVLGEGFLAD